MEQAGIQFAAMFAAMDDAYMQARAADIKDVAKRILNNLLGVVDGGIHSDVPVILAADDLAPSETLQLDKSKILGFVTMGGSGNSHTAILARTMGIPAICGAGEALAEGYNGRVGYIDGETGQLIIDPDAMTQAALKEKYEKQQETKKLLETMKGQEDITLDGKKMLLYCNIGSPEDVAAVLANDGQGIGLFRSEFLYLSASDYPTEDEQFEAYRSVADAMNGKRVVIRTLDIGADKQVDYFDMKEEENPALGVRAIRICLNRPEVFRTQLRALYRASVYGKIAIMFPMITSVWEVKECKRACMSVMKELEAEGIPYDKDTELGIMIETPSSVFVAEELAKLVDLKSGGSVCPPNLKSPVKSSVFSFQWPEQTGISLLFSLRPPHLLFEYAAVLESVDKADLKSARILLLYGFESRQRHHVVADCASSRRLFMLRMKSHLSPAPSLLLSKS